MLIRKFIANRSSVEINSGILIIVGIFSAILGFFREIQIAHFFGVSINSDLYYLGMLTPEIIGGIIGSLSTNIFMKQYQESENPNKYVSSCLVYLLLTILIVLLILETIFPLLTKVIAPGINGSSLSVLILIGRIMLVAVLFSCFFYIFSSILNSKGKFLMTGFLGVFFNLFLIGTTFFLTPIYHIYGLAISYLAANIFRVLVMIPFVWKIFECPNLKLSFLLLKELPKIFITNMIMNLQVILERSFASTIGGGAISAINYAGRINGLPNVFLINSIITVIYPKFIRKLSEEAEELNEFLLKTLKMITYILLFFGLFFMIYREQITGILFSNKNFYSDDLNIVSTLFLFYAPVSLLSGVNQFFIKIAYAYGKINLNVLVMLVSLPFYYGVVLFCKSGLGVNSLGLGLLVYNFVILLTVFVGLNYKLSLFNVKINLSKWIGLIVTPICTYFICKQLILTWSNSVIGLLFMALEYFFIFSVCCYFFDSEVNRILNKKIKQIRLTITSN